MTWVLCRSTKALDFRVSQVLGADREREISQGALLLLLEPLQQERDVLDVNVVVHVLPPLAVEGFVQGRGEGQSAAFLEVEAFTNQGEHGLHLVVGPLAVADGVAGVLRLGGLLSCLGLHSGSGVSLFDGYGSLARIMADWAAGNGSSKCDSFGDLAGSVVGIHVGMRMGPGLVAFLLLLLK